MVAVAQLVERRSVEAEVAGSIPVSHPFYFFCKETVKKTKFYFLNLRTKRVLNIFATI